MTSKRVFLITLTLLSCGSPAMPQAVRYPTEKTVLKTLEPNHPRLMLKEPQLVELKQRIEQDPLLAKCVDVMLAKADDCCRKPPLVYDKKGPRLLHVSRECVRRIYTLGLAFRLTGGEKYVDAARRDLLAVCDFPDWNPSHFLDTAEMSHAVGLGYDWFHHRLDEATREKIRSGLIRHGLKPGLEAYFGEKPMWWTNAEHNWNQVCNGGLIIGALAVAETDPEYARKIVPEAVRLMPKAMVNYGPDGAWGEGPGYWRYATEYTVLALAALESALGTDFGLSETEGLPEAGDFILHVTGPTGLLFNYADTGQTRTPRTNIPCLFWLARRFDNPLFAEAERVMVEKHPGDPWDVLWYLASGRRPRALDLDKHFRGPVEVAVFRSAWDDPDALFVAVKAGFNQVNHAHCDVGSFVFDALGVRWAVDLGADDYNLPGYWDGRKQDGRRWGYYRLSALSHNVPLLDGRNQDVRAVTKIERFTSTPQSARAVLDLTSAYPPARSVRRGVAVIDRRSVLIQDEFDLDVPVEITWGMMTAAKVDRDGGRAALTEDGKTLHAEILSPADAVFTVESAEQEPPQAVNKGFGRLVIRLPRQQGRVTVAVHLAPAWPDGKTTRPPEVKPLSKW